jgi:bifunctional DNA-binding transcriptional regulator/antitoxin component of YhaV-PrlF toxin-antitoxin module
VKTKKHQRQTWRLKVTPKGILRLPLALREAAQLWEGDAVQAAVRDCAGKFEILLRILPHGFTPAEIEKAERRALREIERDRKAGRLIPFNATPKPAKKKSSQ